MISPRKILKNLIASTGFAGLILGSAFVNASEEQQLPSAKISDYIFEKAKPLGKLPTPKYPKRELARYSEGCTVLSLVIDKEGSVKDPIVVTASDSPLFDKESIRVAKTFKFTPATLNGEITESSDNSYKICYSIYKDKGGGTSAFRKRYRAARKHLSAKKYDDFLETMSSIKEKYALRHYERAFYWFLMSLYHFDLGENTKATESLTRALSKELAFLPEEMLTQATTKLYTLQLQQGQYRDAFATVNNTLKLELDSPALNQLKTHKEMVKTELEKLEGINVAGTINDKNIWRHELYHKDFTILAEPKNIDQIELRCDSRVRRFDYSETHKNWRIPSSWGECTLVVKGTANTSLTLVEKRTVLSGPSNQPGE